MAKILLVDDNRPRIADTPLDLLQRNGKVEVIYAGSGPEALSAVEHLSPDAILAALPAQGTELLGILQDIHFRYPSLPIILMTADAVAPVLSKALQQSAVTFVPKANMGRYLAQTLDHVLELSRTEGRQRLVGYLCQTEVQLFPGERPGPHCPSGGTLQEVRQGWKAWTKRHVCSWESRCTRDC